MPKRPRCGLRDILLVSDAFEAPGRVITVGPNRARGPGRPHRTI